MLLGRSNVVNSIRPASKCGLNVHRLFSRNSYEGKSYLAYDIMNNPRTDTSVPSYFPECMRTQPTLSLLWRENCHRRDLRGSDGRSTGGHNPLKNALSPRQTSGGTYSFSRLLPPPYS
jgi:hypothetical protein